MVTPQLSAIEARAALESLSSGLPPSPSITDMISVGMDEDLETFTDEYFGPHALLPNTDQGAFKLVEAYYGGGKTHYLRAVERRAHSHGFASAFIELNKESCPLTRFDLIYKTVAESLTLADGAGRTRARGIMEVIRAWIKPADEQEADLLDHADQCLSAVKDLPLPSMRIALRDAVHAIASGDDRTTDEIHVYLHAGKISAGLRKRGILEPIDAKSGALALRSLAVWLRQIGIPGLVLVLDEGDRSLSIASSKDRVTASNNLVQLINEAGKGADWPGVLFLYSIPGWQDFEHAFGTNAALLQRVRNTGFPNLPPAPRIVLDDRLPSDSDRIAFCAELGERLAALFEAAYPGKVTETAVAAYGRQVAQLVVHRQQDVSFRRFFVQAFINTLYQARGGRSLSRIELEQIVDGEAAKLSREKK